MIPSKELDMMRRFVSTHRGIPGFNTAFPWDWAEKLLTEVEGQFTSMMEEEYRRDARTSLLACDNVRLRLALKRVVNKEDNLSEMAKKALEGK